MDNFLEIQHASLIIKDTEASLAFYCDVLGMIEADRTTLNFPGAWLQIGAQQIHLLEVPNPDSEHGRLQYGGRDRHIAIMVKQLDEIKQRLDNAGITYSCSRSGRAAIFVRDPDGNTLEIIQQSG